MLTRDELAKAIYGEGVEPCWMSTVDDSPNSASYELADRILAALPPTEHVYVVGLPVIITVWSDGRVTYDVDTAEAGAAVHEAFSDGTIEIDYDPTLDIRYIHEDHARRTAG